MHDHEIRNMGNIQSFAHVWHSQLNEAPENRNKMHYQIFSKMNIRTPNQ